MRPTPPPYRRIRKLWHRRKGIEWEYSLDGASWFEWLSPFWRRYWRRWMRRLPVDFD